MNLIAWLIVGGALGWLITFVLYDRSMKSLLIHVILGIVGAVTAGYLVTPMFYASTFSLANFSIPGLFLSLAGAVSLLTVVHFMQRKSTMKDVDIQAKWMLVRSKMHVRWNKLTEEDIEQVNGDHDRFIKLLQERYGCDGEKAEDDLQSYLRAVVVR